MGNKNHAIQSSNGRKELNCIRCLDLTIMDVRYNYGKDIINAKTFIESLQMIKTSYKDKAVVHIFLDNTGYHKHKAWSNNNLPMIQSHYFYRKIIKDNA